MQKRLREVVFRSAALTVVLAYLFFFLEWVFHVTKPSFLSSLPFLDGVAALFLAAVPVALVALGAQLLFCLAAFLSGRNGVGEKQIYLIYLVPVTVLVATLFLLAENFTYTLFGFNVGSFIGVERIVYVLPLSLLIAFLLKYFHDKEQALQGTARIKAGMYAAGLLVSMSVLAIAIKASMPDESGAKQLAGKKENQPNILILSVDGVNAERMSMYGSERHTTPVLEELKKESLFAENSFTNCANTGCSVTALLTGKSPLTTRLIFPPDILTGKNAYEHLPGLLKRAGYKTLDVSVRYYADAYDLNFRRAFDQAGARTESVDLLAELGWPEAERDFGNAAYFLRYAYERIEDRVLHLFGIKDMDNPYLAVTQQGPAGPAWDGDDPDRLERLIGFIENNKRGFFAHVHFLDTHGPKFVPRNRKFSDGQEQEQGWMTDFYDDAIADFDDNVGKVISYLKKEGLYDKTIIVITSDHGSKWSTSDRLPLMIRFPNAEFRGVIENNTQRLDIAPTLLKYLGMDVPAWMEGRPLIGGQLDRQHPVFSALRAKATQASNGHWVSEDNPPPFYNLGVVSMIICDNWYSLPLNNGGKMTVKTVAGHTRGCDKDSLPDAEQAKMLILTKLKQSGYRVEDAGYQLQ